MVAGQRPFLLCVPVHCSTSIGLEYVPRRQQLLWQFCKAMYCCMLQSLAPHVAHWPESTDRLGASLTGHEEALQHELWPG